METLKTPRGKVQWAKVVVPDTKYDPKGVYSIDMLLPADDPACQEMCELLDKAIQDAVAKEVESRPERFKSLPNGMPLTAPAYTEVDGNIKFKFKLKSSITTKSGETFTQRPIIVDSKGQSVLRVVDGKVMNNNFSIGNGSVCAIHYQPYPYFVASTKQVGVTLRLKAVQIFKLEKFGGGFDFEEDDSFEYEDETNDYGDNKESSSPKGAGEENGDF